MRDKKITKKVPLFSRLWMKENILKVILISWVRVVAVAIKQSKRNCEVHVDFLLPFHVIQLFT